MESYPEDVSSRLKDLVKNTVIVDAHGMAGDLGNVKSQNIILLGALIKALNLEDIDWEKVLENNVPKKALELNKKAFKIGLEF